MADHKGDIVGEQVRLGEGRRQGRIEGQGQTRSGGRPNVSLMMSVLSEKFFFSLGRWKSSVELG